MPIDVKCPICNSMNEVYGSDRIRKGTIKRCAECGAFLDPNFMKEELESGKIKEWLWIGNDCYLGSGSLIEYIVSAIDKDKTKMYALCMRVEKIELLKESGQTEKIIYSDKEVNQDN